MNGPEHYREAERLVALSIRQRESESRDDAAPLSALTMAQAQVNATLALAAATAFYGYTSSTRDEEFAWREVTS